MKYDYQCHKCRIYFIVEHGMNEKPKVECPQCKSVKKVERAFITAPIFYTKGYGWLDKEGRRRDMNLYKLIHDDPYAKMRQPGEKDDLAQRLRKGGKHNPKGKSFAVKKV